MTSHTVGGITTSYGYDLADQLITESRLGYVASYTYDANGNRATRTVNGQTETHVSDAADKLMSISVGGNTVRSFTYDGRGRRKTDTYAGSTTTYSWDAESRLTSLARPGVTTSSFGYNGLDARVSKTDSTGTFSFKRNGAGVTDPVLSDGAATYTPGISEQRAGSSKFLHSGMKNADAQSGASANVDSSRTYDAFGNVTGSVGTWSGPFGYAGGFGYQEDPDHGLRLLGHRYYDSSTGRFISKDPIGDGRNWTAYCAGNPTGHVDNDGLTHSSLTTPGNAPMMAELIAEGVIAGPGVAAPVATAAAVASVPKMSAASAGVWRVALWFQNLHPAVQALLEALFAGAFLEAVNAYASGANASRLHGDVERAADKLPEGDVTVRNEVSFKNGKEVPYGTKGSIRIDTGIYHRGQLTAVVDYKFGNALLSFFRRALMRRHMPGYHGPFIQMSKWTRPSAKLGGARPGGL